jgi:hypothetical protein
MSFTNWVANPYPHRTPIITWVAHFSFTFKPLSILRRPGAGDKLGSQDTQDADIRPILFSYVRAVARNGSPDISLFSLNRFDYMSGFFGSRLLDGSKATSFGAAADF